uniref:Uncharacterized protein n=1 Tax=Panagrolaimus davidi TaxID=227884 RepID=A0A914QNH2_9BILA
MSTDYHYNNDNRSKNRNKDSWKKCDKDIKALENLNANKSNKNIQFITKSSSKNSSTLSLHIAAYENSIEADDSDAKDNMIDKSSTFNKSLKKPFTSLIDAFEIPRQQDDGKKREVMQFKASQKLRNPNKSGGGGGNQSKASNTAKSVGKVKTDPLKGACKVTQVKSAATSASAKQVKAKREVIQEVQPAG